jgi:Uma2 family endonuclease
MSRWSAGPWRGRERESKETILNPTVLIEVLSSGTERYDRGEKFEHYKRIPSFEEYVLVSQNEPLVEVWNRQGESRSKREGRSGARLALRSIDCELVVDELYRGVFDL